MALQQHDSKQQLAELRSRIGEHDVQLNSIYNALEFYDEKASDNKWKDRERIGFRT